MNEYNIETQTHGRYLVTGPRASNSPLLVSFHGYAESAELDMARLQQLRGIEKWVLVSVQALHRFYRSRFTDVVASWMTRQNRELAIADNVLYTSKVIEAVSREWSTGGVLVLSGFSQGVAMAFRCAATLEQPPTALVALGGEVPPELESNELKRIPAVLIGRGNRDEWYTPEKLAADEKRLRDAGVAVQVVTFEGSHEWSREFASAVSQFLARL